MTTLKSNEFKSICRIAQERWGLHITEAKRELVTARITKFLRKSAFSDARSYINHIESDSTEEEKLELFDLLSTNVTSFFREREQFNYLEREFYTPLARGNLTTPGKRIRIWSAACSTGQEPYSMVMHAMEHLPNLSTWDFKVLATDLSNTAVENARRAVYPMDAVKDLPKEMVKSHFLKGAGDHAGMVKVAPHVRDLVTIRRLNLMEQWPFKGPFDVIFCRNVMIYFDLPTRLKLVRRMLDLLRPGGILAVGSAETLANLDLPIRVAQPSVYLK